MATVTHHIYSHYDPQQRDTLLRETGQVLEDREDPWQTESSFTAQRRLAAAPRFVPATTSYSEWDCDNSGNTVDSQHEHDVPGQELAEWYRSMQRNAPVAHHPEEDPLTRDLSAYSKEPKNRRVDRRNKNNWFIMKAIQSESSSTSPTPPPTLADILSRDPPPSATQEKFIPPVWLHLGPSNKGFAMLQQSGWNEGEGLGSTVIRRRNNVPSFVDRRKPSPLGGPSGGEGAVKRENVPLDTNGQVRDIHREDVIDLTLSESECGDLEDGSDSFLSADTHIAPSTTHPPLREPYSQKALLTPIPTILKSDRLGIGLRAKTFGPFKASQKRVTHNAAAMAAHIRAAEEARKQKKLMGRGRRGFERAQKADEENRKRMLAFLNE